MYGGASSPQHGTSATGRMSQVVSVESLQGNVENKGRQFIYFALAYYICVPALYYWAALGWEGIDAFYVSIPHLFLLYLSVC